LSSISAVGPEIEIKEKTAKVMLEKTFGLKRETMSTKSTKRIWEVYEPYPDVFARDIEPSMFAASLHAVESGTADRDYTDPERFFAKTFITRSLENVLESALMRLMERLAEALLLCVLKYRSVAGKPYDDRTLPSGKAS